MSHLFLELSLVTSVELMEKMNNITEFILIGLTQNMQLQIFSFVVFFIVYLLTLVGNMLIIITVSSSRALGSPMYFFLSFLSLIDGCCSSSMTPKMLADSFSVRKPFLSVDV